MRLADLQIPRSVIFAFAVVSVVVLSGALMFIGSKNGNVTIQGSSFATPIEAGDMNAARMWAKQKCGGRSIRALSEQYGVEATMEAVVRRVVEAVPVESQAAAATLCERELRRAGKQ